MKKMLSTLAFALLAMVAVQAQRVPKEVQQVLEQYVQILRTSESLDACAERFRSIAGGSLVEDDPVNVSLRSTVKDFSLKKDFNNIRFYANPVRISRVTTEEVTKIGSGESALGGTIYKIWIAREDSSTGMPAPVSIIMPRNHPVIKTPKVVNIGSF
ncbi:MAG: hypothetical protein RMJ97_04360 [Raineya sp.]|nr:hypothetical protein [Raineya sp.]MDW8296098.1 hypothetical protein [Raineya sp.]